MSARLFTYLLLVHSFVMQWHCVNTDSNSSSNSSKMQPINYGRTSRYCGILILTMTNHITVKLTDTAMQQLRNIHVRTLSDQPPII